MRLCLGSGTPDYMLQKPPLLVEIMKNHPLPRIPKTVIPKTRGIVNGFCLAVPGKWQVLSESLFTDAVLGLQFLNVSLFLFGSNTKTSPFLLITNPLSNTSTDDK